jgi:hypothetical protein
VEGLRREVVEIWRGGRGDRCPDEGEMATEATDYLMCGERREKSGRSTRAGVMRRRVALLLRVPFHAILPGSYAFGSFPAVVKGLIERAVRDCLSLSAFLSPLLRHSQIHTLSLLPSPAYLSFDPRALSRPDIVLPSSAVFFSSRLTLLPPAPPYSPRGSYRNEWKEPELAPAVDPRLNSNLSASLCCRKKVLCTATSLCCRNSGVH